MKIEYKEDPNVSFYFLSWLRAQNSVDSASKRTIFRIRLVTVNLKSTIEQLFVLSMNFNFLSFYHKRPISIIFRYIFFVFKTQT